MKSLLATVLFAIVITGTTFDANAFDHTTLGSPTCESWIRDINTTKDKTNVSWLTGYLSGAAALFSTENKIDLLENVDSQAIFKLADKFCTENPNKNLSGAGDIIFFEIIKQKMPNNK